MNNAADQKPTSPSSQKESHIVLVGLMGCGKSSVARQLSTLSHRSYIDTDSMVEAHSRQRITDIFASLGEKRFRELEYEMISKAVSEAKPAIISTGGGAIISERNRKLLWTNGYVVYLKGSVECLVERVKQDTTRPLLKEKNPQEILTQLLSERSTFYEEAHEIIDIDHQSIKEIASTILLRYKAYKAKGKK